MLVASWQKHNMLGSVYCSVISFLAWRGVSGACQHGKVQDRLLAFQMPLSLLLVRRMCTASWCGAVLCLIQPAGLLPQYWVLVETLAIGIGMGWKQKSWVPANWENSWNSMILISTYFTILPCVKPLLNLWMQGTMRGWVFPSLSIKVLNDCTAYNNGPPQEIPI